MKLTLETADTKIPAGSVVVTNRGNKYLLIKRYYSTETDLSVIDLDTMTHEEDVDMDFGEFASFLETNMETITKIIYPANLELREI